MLEIFVLNREGEPMDIMMLHILSETTRDLNICW